MSNGLSTIFASRSRARGPATEYCAQLIADGDQLHVEVRPEPLPAKFEVLQNFHGVGRRRRDEIAVFGKARRRPVIHHDAVLAQHDAVARPPDRQRAHHVDVDAVEKFSRVRAMHLDLAESRDIADADTVSHRRHFANDGRQPIVFARLRVVLRAQPKACLDEHRAPLLRPVVRGGKPRRLEMLLPMLACERAECDSRVRRPRRRDAGRRNRLAGELREDGEAVDARRLALVRRHAERRVALQMLDGPVAFALGKRDVGGGDVVLQIDKGFMLCALDVPEGGDARSLRLRQPEVWRPWHQSPWHEAAAAPEVGTFAETGRQRIGAVRCTRDGHALG